jgi:23S rRNA pseudouridine1911/1915/1917 synthase
MVLINIPIIYQDHHLLIINKPAGIVTHPTYKHANDTMWDVLLAYLSQQGGDDWQPPDLLDDPAWENAPEHIKVMLREKRHQRLWKEDGLLPRPCLLHRLDKDTSGIIALARTERSRRYLIHQFEQHTIVKRYLAVVARGAFAWSHPRTRFIIKKLDDGEHETQVTLPFDLLSLSSDELILDGPLQRDPGDRRRCIVGPDGQSATTKLSVLATEGDFALLEVHPITGRTHQIRAHLAALGYAIVGDQTYAPVAEKGTPQAALNRQFLHAYSLELRCYPDNAQCAFVAPLADDLAAWMKQYFSSGWKAL